jgi:hypothetical protein
MLNNQSTLPFWATFRCPHAAYCVVSFVFDISKIAGLLKYLESTYKLPSGPTCISVIPPKPRANIRSSVTVYG